VFRGEPFPLEASPAAIHHLTPVKAAAKL
jgi:hypothetical protein